MFLLSHRTREGTPVQLPRKGTELSPNLGPTSEGKSGQPPKRKGRGTIATRLLNDVLMFYIFAMFCPSNRQRESTLVQLPRKRNELTPKQGPTLAGGAAAAAPPAVAGGAAVSGSGVGGGVGGNGVGGCASGRW